MGIHSLLRAICASLLFFCLTGRNGSCQMAPDSPPAAEPCPGIGCSAPTDPQGTSQPESKSRKEPGPVTVKSALLSLPEDQKAIWTSPFHLRAENSFWLAPFAATSAVLIGSDQHSMQRARSNPDAISLSNSISDGGLIGLTAVPGAMFFWGSLHGEQRARETGLLSGEAMINSLAVNQGLKLIFGRERPTSTDGKGKFFQVLGNEASFPSTHATLSWTAASVIAHEYPGWLSQTLAYGTAATVSLTRVTGRQHFPSDVVVGSALGWLVGRQVFNAHHYRELDDLNYGTFSQPRNEFNPDTLGSPFVPLDSWIYPELQRLAALGYIKSQFTGLQPWTRAECRRQVEEAEYYAQNLSSDSSIRKSIDLLKQEFANDGKHYYSAQIDSVYTRYTQISGTPLRDSYHFGQTLWSDFGRPYDEGVNMIAGTTGSVVAGRFFFYAQGEYQHAPGRGPLTDAQRQLISTADLNPVLPAAPVDSIDRFYPIDMYGGVNLGQYALTFGKQSLWLGPTESGPLMLSDNADPMYTLDFKRTTPLVLPGFLRLLGQIRGEFLFSKLSGHQFPQRPFFNLQKVSFHLTENLEVGFTRASLWAGVGHPFTGDSLARNFTSLSSSVGAFGDRNDPGDRKSGFDFSYRVPGLRNWLTIYTDMYSDDDPSPLANPRRAAVNPGFYLSHVPGISKLDLRGEASSTQMLTSHDFGPTFIYFNNQYHDANTNKGFLFGNPVGRDARDYQGWSTYHFSPTNKLMFGFRQLKASNQFFPGGGTQTDASVSLEWRARPDLTINTSVQHERWLIPVLSAGAQQNVTGQLELRYTPHLQFHRD